MTASVYKQSVPSIYKVNGFSISHPNHEIAVFDFDVVILPIRKKKSGGDVLIEVSRIIDIDTHKFQLSSRSLKVSLAVSGSPA